MKYLMIFVFLFFTQSPKMVQLKEFYDGTGVIFDKTAKYPFTEPDYAVPYTPTIEDVKKVENFLLQNYYEYWVNFYRAFDYDDRLINKLLKSKYKNPENVKKKYKKYNRQYIGYINSSNDTIIYIGLLNFRNKRKAEYYFEGWREQIIFGFGDFYQENQRNYRFNISKKEFVYKVMKSD